MQETAKPTCPHCQSKDVIFKAKIGKWECLNSECGEFFDPITDNSKYLNNKTETPKAIFFSYGHDDNKELVDRFKADLEKRGHTVWIDYKEIDTWNDWRGKITQGIHDSDLALAFLSKHATRDPGVCLNEIAMALNIFGTLYPVLLEPVQDVTPPVTISHLQWQDLSQWRDIRDGKVAGKDWARWYEEKLIQIITLLEGEASEFEGDINGLRSVLDPAKFTSDIAYQIPDFTGREWVFDAYEDWLANRPQSRLFWIKAGPGVGKTAIAAMLAHTRQSAVVSAWFCQANSIERRDPKKALCSIAFQLATRWDDYRRKLRFQLGLNTSTNPEDRKELREKLLKKNEADLFNFLFAEPLTGLIWRDHRLVVVIDALDEATDANGQNPLVDLLVTKLATLPSWLNFVVTSRPESAIVAKLQGFAPFELDTEDKRNREDLSTYLQTGLAKRNDFTSLPQADQMHIQTVLLDKSQGMILYLQQILKGLEEDSIKLDTIEKIPGGLGSLYRIAFDHLYGGDKLQTVYDTEVQPLLRLLLAAPEPLPPALAQEILGWDKETYLRRRNRLGSYVLDTPQGSKLFHKTLYEWLGNESSAPFYLEALPGSKVIAAHLWKCFDSTEDKFKLEWPHQTKHWLPELLQLLPQWEDGDSLRKMGNYLQTFALYEKSEELLRRSLVINEKMLGSEHPDVATDLNNLAWLLSSKGIYAEAEPLYLRALEIRGTVLGPGHPDTAISLINLAWLMARKGDYAEAEPLLRRALEINEKVLDPAHPDTAISLNNLAWLLKLKGDYSAAEPLERRALEIREAVLGPEHPEVATSLNNLAEILSSKGDYEAAEPLYRRALEIRKAVLGPEHQDTIEEQQSVARCLREQGKLEETLALFESVVDTLTRVNGESGEKTLRAQKGLAATYKRAGDISRAKEILSDALEKAVANLGEENELTKILREDLLNL